VSKEHKRLPSGKALVAPTIFPIMMFVLIEKYFSVGGVIYAHGVMSMLIFFIALAGIGVLVWECFAIPIFTYNLIKFPACRNTKSYLVLVAGAAYVVFIITFGIRLIYVIVK